MTVMPTPLLPAAPSPARTSAPAPRTRGQDQDAGRDGGEPTRGSQTTRADRRGDRAEDTAPAHTRRASRSSTATSEPADPGTTDDFRTALESALAGLPQPAATSPAATPAHAATPSVPTPSASALPATDPLAPTPTLPTSIAPAAGALIVGSATAPSPTSVSGPSSLRGAALLTAPTPTAVPAGPGTPDVAAPAPPAAATTDAPIDQSTPPKNTPTPPPVPDGATPTTATAYAAEGNSATASGGKSGAPREFGSERQRATLSEVRGAPDSPTDAPTPTSPADTTPVGTPPVAATSPTTPTPTTPSSRSEQIVRQVFPEIAQLTQTATPGTHRLAITLHPEDLGEVKVTLVMRAGSIQVHLAADTPAARAALADGSHDLHRMLELAAPAETRVVVREAGTGTSTDARQQQGQQPQQAQTALGQGAGQSGGQQRHAHETGEPGQQGDEFFRGPASGPSRTTVAPTATPSTASTTTGTGRLDRLM